jgi:quinol monooxygenase YgiN
VDVLGPNVLRFFEQYEDVAALDAHSRTDHFQKFEEHVSSLVAGEPEVTQFVVVSTTEPSG